MQLQIWPAGTKKVQPFYKCKCIHRYPGQVAQSFVLEAGTSKKVIYPRVSLASGQQISTGPFLIQSFLHTIGSGQGPYLHRHPEISIHPQGYAKHESGIDHWASAQQ